MPAASKTGAEDVALNTRLTQQLGLTHPIISAPMAFAAGG
jgi:IMP dehydrogenase/GMP reductase